MYGCMSGVQLFPTAVNSIPTPTFGGRHFGFGFTPGAQIGTAFSQQPFCSGFGFNPAPAISGHDWRSMMSLPYESNSWDVLPWNLMNNANWHRPIHHQFVPQAAAQPFAPLPEVPGGYATWPYTYTSPQTGWGAAQSFQTPFRQSDLSGVSSVPFAASGQVSASSGVPVTFTETQTQTLPGRLPAINIWEEDANLCVEAEVPGVSLDDVDLQIAGRALYIRTGRLLTTSHADQQRRLIHGERVPGGFQRVIHLPVEIDGEKVEAKLNNGVLRLTLPKLNAQQRRTIRVNQVATA